MQRNINELIGYHIGATDGGIGKVEEFYFDDLTWKVRYLIVKTGSWLFGRTVLISPDVLVRGSREPGIFPAQVTKEQVRNSPDIDTDKPVSRRQEIELYGHYGWEAYWGSGFYAGGFANIADAVPIIDEKIIQDSGNSGSRTEIDPHLRSSQRVTGYRIHCLDGDMGHVIDFIIDDQSWQITSLLVDTHRWIGGEKVLIATRHIKEIQWEQASVLIDVTIETLTSFAADSRFAQNKLL